MCCVLCNAAGGPSDFFAATPKRRVVGGKKEGTPMAMGSAGVKKQRRADLLTGCNHVG